MQVSDQAGNIAKARTLIFVDPFNTIRVSDDVTVQVEPGVTRGSVLWVDNATPLQLEWRGVFSNMQHVNSHFLTEVLQMGGVLDDTRPGDGEMIKKLGRGGVGYRVVSATSNLSDTGVCDWLNRTIFVAINKQWNTTRPSLATEVQFVCCHKVLAVCVVT